MQDNINNPISGSGLGGVTQAPARTGRGYRAGDPVTDVAADAPPAPPSLTVPYLEFLQSTTKTRRWSRP
jgi:hypothetical protein